MFCVYTDVYTAVCSVFMLSVSITTYELCLQKWITCNVFYLNNTVFFVYIIVNYNVFSILTAILTIMGSLFSKPVLITMCSLQVYTNAYCTLLRYLTPRGA